MVLGPRRHRPTSPLRFACTCTVTSWATWRPDLRTHDIPSPWPEEFNRRAVDIVTKYYFAPRRQVDRTFSTRASGVQDTGSPDNTGSDALRTRIRDG